MKRCRTFSKMNLLVMHLFQLQTRELFMIFFFSKISTSARKICGRRYLLFVTQRYSLRNAIRYATLFVTHRETLCSPSFQLGDGDSHLHAVSPGNLQLN